MTYNNINPGLDKLLRNINPYNQERQGRKSADPVLASNRITDPDVARKVLKTAFNFSEFQSLALYHRNGFFPRRVDYNQEMPLLPQMLSPFFGKVIGELAFASYLHSVHPNPVKPAFLSLGAGRGYLDHDLIEHITDSSFQFPGYESYTKIFREKSTFRITDLGRKAVSLAKKELQDVINRPELRGRIRLEEMDAAYFSLPEEALGIVYCNELIDNTPVEPVIKIENSLYAEKIIVFDESHRTEYKKMIERGEFTTGLIPKEKAKKQIDDNDTANLGFEPLFLPVEYDPGLNTQINNLQSFSNIDDAAFNGIYPVHICLDSMFSSIKKSFRNGIVIIIDYRSRDSGMHNWNLAVNKFKHYKFGTEDFDFQVDSRQIIEKAERNGIRYENLTDLGSTMKRMISLVTGAGKQEIKRNMQANGLPENYDDEKRETYLKMHAQLIKYLAPSYDVITFKF